jgi:hypothetical protein
MVIAAVEAERMTAVMLVALAAPVTAVVVIVSSKHVI